MAFLDKKFSEDEEKNLQNNLKNFNISNTELIIRQKESDISQEILSEINKNKASLSNKDIKIKQLTEELEKYKIEDSDFAKEVKILFPNIKDFSFGRLNSFVSDSLSTTTLMLYTPVREEVKGKEVDKEVDIARLQQWLSQKFADKNIKIIKE